MRVATSGILGCLLLSVACGGKPAQDAGGKVPSAPAPDGGAGAGNGTASRPPPELGPLPPMAKMPPAGVAGSRKATRKEDAALASCAGAAFPRAKDPDGLVKRVGEACAKAPAGAKLKPLGAARRGQQDAAAPHADQKLRVEAGKCYRVYFATDEGARDVVVVARDSAGDVVAESPGPALPESGLMCFTAADELSLLVSVGSGKAAWVLQPWGE